jgi:hypothetical protein
MSLEHAARFPIWAALWSAALVAAVFALEVGEQAGKSLLVKPLRRRQVRLKIRMRVPRRST